MKAFNLIIIGVLVFVALGFIFFRDGFLKTQKTQTPAATTSKVLMDRLNYIEYSAQNLQNSYKSGRPVLFFAATLWCQTCSQLDKEIKERSAELPSDVTLLKVDYDNDKTTKAKYNVTTQHTLIQLDGSGKEVKRWIGGNFDALVQNIQ